MKWVLIVYLCHWTGAFSRSCETKEIAIFPDVQSCEKASIKYQYNSPVCGLKEARHDQ